MCSERSEAEDQRQRAVAILLVLLFIEELSASLQLRIVDRVIVQIFVPLSARIIDALVD